MFLTSFHITVLSKNTSQIICFNKYWLLLALIFYCLTLMLKISNSHFVDSGDGFSNTWQVSVPLSIFYSNGRDNTKLAHGDQVILRERYGAIWSLLWKRTLGQKSLLRAVSVRTKTILISGCVGEVWVCRILQSWGHFFWAPWLYLCQSIAISK